jgi:hypothetical protein
MKRTTVMADDELVRQLKELAEEEGVSLAEVIRQGMVLRLRQGRRPRFVGTVRTGRPTAVADEAETLDPQPHPWR